MLKLDQIQKDADITVTRNTVTRNEFLDGLNQADKFMLSIMVVDGETYERSFHVRNPFIQEPGWSMTSINPNLGELLARAVRGEELR